MMSLASLYDKRDQHNFNIKSCKIRERNFNNLHGESSYDVLTMPTKLKNGI